MKISREFLIALKLHKLPAYLIAQRAGISSSMLSRLIRGIDPVKPGDPRILAVGEVLGLGPDEVFSSGDVRGSLTK